MRLYAYSMRSAVALMTTLLAFNQLWGQAPLEPLSWDNLEHRFDEEARQGFSGVLLVVKDDKVVFQKAWGFADRDQQVPNRLDTIFAIGSTPIDFTQAGILLLAEQGKLQLSDPLTKYFDSVPLDKQAITIDHLMNARSGLPDFHDLPSDKNKDHTYIDREEAVRRIMAQPLLFAPGEGQSHSHSAWGLLAAIIEKVSGQTYPEFTKEHLFGPAGMVDTGFFGEPYDVDRMAIGYGDAREGEINAPPYWGPTSWLVMGSGGQVSTVGDLNRWVQAIRDGKILGPAAQEQQLVPPGQLLTGGDMFGFELMYGFGPDSHFIIVSNTGRHRDGDGWNELGRELLSLVHPRPRSKFSLGLAMAVDRGEESVVVHEVIPGGAAARDGLQTGDRLISAAGIPLFPDPSVAMGPYLQSGKPISFELDRDGERIKVVVTPDPTGDRP